MVVPVASVASVGGVANADVASVASVALRDVEFCVLDLETTGGSSEFEAITEIGAVKYCGGEEVGRFARLVNPLRAIPPFITVLTGITDSMVANAPTIDETLGPLLEFIGDSVLVAHNARFDVGFVNAALVRDHTRLDGASVFQYALADVTDTAAMRLAFASVASVAPIDGVVNATGVVAFGGVGELDDATLAQLFAVNATAPIVMLRESAALITDGGFFVNISGVVATQPVAGMAAYSASKAAAWAAMSAVARELRRRQIEVIDARPPHTETGLATRAIAGVAPKMPLGLAPDVVAARIVAAIVAGERDLPVEAFAPQ